MGFHPEWPEIEDWIGRSKQILIKKLSRNDCSWADDSRKHQRGFYVPAPIQDSQFFPGLRSNNPSKTHILDARFQTFWPASGELKLSALKHFTNKGTEFHCTRVPREQFASLSPASLLVGGVLREPVSGASYWFMVVDSASEEAEILETVFSLQSDFHFGLFSPDELRTELGEQERLIAEMQAALKNGTLQQFIEQQRLPSPSELAQQAQHAWLQQRSLSSLDPFSIGKPGDAVMSISRDIEYALYKRAELRQRASQVAGLLLRSADTIASLVHGFGELDQLFLSAAQTRKSRAGLSFEHHVKRLLVDGRVRHEAQIMLGSRRPDFVMPNVATVKGRTRADSLILSLKTTLRERWKQLSMERRHCPVFLATVDDRVSSASIDEMGSLGIVLVVPESLKGSDEAVYKTKSAVITFHDFFVEQIASRRPTLIIS